MPPGEYLPDSSEGITRVEDLPRPLVEEFRRAVDRELAEQNKLRETEDFKIGVNTKRGELPPFVGR